MHVVSFLRLAGRAGRPALGWAALGRRPGGVRLAGLAVILALAGAVGGTALTTSPVAAAGVARQLAVGFNFSCLLNSVGAVKCWGSNSDGQLGDGTRTTRTSPTQVTGLTSGVKQISAGGFHACALTTGGAVKCWGSNDHGQLGDGTKTDRVTPQQVGGLTSGVAQVSSGLAHSCAVTTAGGLKCWGGNNNGQLGDGTLTSRTAAVQVKGLSSGVSSVAAGYLQTCAVTTAGAAKCWGSNYAGEVGDGTVTPRLAPVSVVGLTSGTKMISAGGVMCAVAAGRAVKCWGANYYGQVGDGTTAQRHSPTQVLGITSGALWVGAGNTHACAVTSAGAAKCWGGNDEGQLGDGTITQRHSPRQVYGLTSGIAKIGAGSYFSCALTTAARVKCWGDNDLGQLGDGTRTDRHRPVEVVGF